MTRVVAAALLWSLLGLFVLRVLGQLLAYTASPMWLPPHRRWFSGVMPYHWLLPAQLVLIAVMTPVNRAVGTGTGPLDGPNPGASWWVLVVGSLYALAMVVRTVRRMMLPPHRRGVVIPIVFHFVLAAWVLVYGAWLGRSP